jgi:hypothetical protein
MKHWFDRLMAILAGRDRACAPRRTDWRGRPVGENTGGVIPLVSHPKVDPYATLRLHWFAEVPGAAPGCAAG